MRIQLTVEYDGLWLPLFFLCFLKLSVALSPNLLNSLCIYFLRDTPFNRHEGGQPMLGDLPVSFFLLNRAAPPPSRPPPSTPPTPCISFECSPCCRRAVILGLHYQPRNPLFSSRVGFLISSSFLVYSLVFVENILS